MRRIEIMSCYTNINSHYKIFYWSIFAVFIRAFLRLLESAFYMHANICYILPSNPYCVLN